jgi:hypothetical protein
VLTHQWGQTDSSLSFLSLLKKWKIFPFLKKEEVENLVEKLFGRLVYPIQQCFHPQHLSCSIPTPLSLSLLILFQAVFIIVVSLIILPVVLSFCYRHGGFCVLFLTHWCVLSLSTYENHRGRIWTADAFPFDAQPTARTWPFNFLDILFSSIFLF